MGFQTKKPNPLMLVELLGASRVDILASSASNLGVNINLLDSKGKWLQGKGLRAIISSPRLRWMSSVSILYKPKNHSLDAYAFDEAMAFDYVWIVIGKMKFQNKVLNDAELEVRPRPRGTMAAWAAMAINTRGRQEGPIEIEMEDPPTASGGSGACSHYSGFLEVVDGKDDGGGPRPSYGSSSTCTGSGERMQCLQHAQFTTSIQTNALRKELR
ncbi:hypothetical protein NE237_013083 [Protea cynaroides]|uniref:Uncharacterized protein n=1 Tax=Protea cynaroides TaxID=273540 RepID=A0A9Q0JZG6_9MAGN|nr:hypothetical protein NE237_013083 [Protea cynaroides]